MRLILLGAPGAGKGTQAEILGRLLSIPTISTGNILRAAMKEGTEVGLKAKSYVESGKLVPDDVIIRAVEQSGAMQPQVTARGNITKADLYELRIEKSPKTLFKLTLIFFEFY